jgi:hypothetical protein
LIAPKHISAAVTYGATMLSDHIIATITEVIWSEEHLWNVSVLQRVHISDLVMLCLCVQLITHALFSENVVSQLHEK